ncbi:hypothetical protein Ndes2526B_g05521 [Nannochloris sp. 'desiccata']|nr:hypothetical protein KSW81_007382 [Chlorella desiccata (nom. nud.)]KAH7618609.1 putative Damage-control phosphatase [Chlorella desiccata (nom. nud.)]
MTTAAVLPQLEAGEGAASYNPNTFDYQSRSDRQAAGLSAYPSSEDWLKIFHDSIESFGKTASKDTSVKNADKKAAAFAAMYREKLDALSSTINCLELCRLREEALIEAGFKDIYLDIKTRENENALELLPEVLAELDQQENLHERWELIIRGVCAANIFDLGAAHTTDMYHSNGGVSFHDAREKLLPRPWIIDNMDRLVNKLSSSPAEKIKGGENGDDLKKQSSPSYKKALLFVDNSGADVILGMLPFARELVRQGTQVIIAANELPSINDITFAELDGILPKIASLDDVLCKAISSQNLVVLSSGNALPVIDLRQVSSELVERAGDADFVMLEGMGRSIETNLNARLGCDVLKIGMVKHPEVAAELGGRMLDCVVKFDEV